MKHGWTMDTLIDQQAERIAFHEAGTPAQYRERAEQEAVMHVLGEIEEGPTKVLLEFLVDKVYGEV